MELANLAGINTANYGKIERGAGNPTFDTIIRLATVLGRDPAHFLTGITEEQLPSSKHSTQTSQKPGTTVRQKKS